MRTLVIHAKSGMPVAFLQHLLLTGLGLSPQTRMQLFSSGRFLLDFSQVRLSMQSE